MVWSKTYVSIFSFKSGFHGKINVVVLTIVEDLLIPVGKLVKTNKNSGKQEYLRKTIFWQKLITLIILVVFKNPYE